MKITRLIALALLSVSHSALAEGSIWFDNHYRVTAPVFDYDGTLVGHNYSAEGTNFFAQIWWAPGRVDDASLLSPASYPVNFRSLANAGYVQTFGTTTLGVEVSGNIKLKPLQPHTPATFQVRAWWGGGTQITSWDQALISNNPLSRFGASPLFQLDVVADPNTSPPETPSDLIGWQSFSLVPEPSTIALAGLAAMALMLRRRRE
jgi:hypothetical protein